MAVDERRRSELFQAAARSFGEDHAVTMFDLLPPPGADLATRADIARMDARFDGLDGRLDRMDARFDGIDARFEAIDVRFSGIERRLGAVEGGLVQLGERVGDLRMDLDRRFEDQNRHLDARFDRVRDEMLAAFRGELVSAVSGQTRAVIVATATATFGIGGLAVTLAQLL